MDPPPGFALVQPLLYRSSPIQSSHLPYLRSLHLKCILSLSPEPPTRVILTFCESNAVEFVHLGSRLTSLSISNSQNTYEPISDVLLYEGLEFLLEKKNYPCLVVCLNGESGTLLGCLRRLQGWILSSTLSEFSSFAGAKTRFNHEQCIELFDTSLIKFPLKEELVSWMNHPGSTIAS